MRRTVATGVALIAAIVGAFVAWDFMKLGRSAPEVLAPGQRATAILIEKSARRLTLLQEGQPLKTYHVALGRDPMGPKQREGDSRTPEGSYTIDSKNGRSRFHLALHISYPSVEDRTRAARQGVNAGSDIMIHGLPNGLGWLGGLHVLRDWTDGCVAVTNSEMEEIWALTSTGTPVQIKP